MNTRDYNKAVKEHSGRLFGFLMKNTQNAELSKDLVQDCFAKLWENRKSVNSAKVKSWLFSVAYNTMLNTLKREAKYDRNQTEVDTPEDSHKQFEYQNQIDLCLQELTAIQRSVLLLRDLEGYAYNEIADMLNLSEAQVKVYLFRARKKIKDQLKSLSKAL